MSAVCLYVCSRYLFKILKRRRKKETGKNLSISLLVHTNNANAFISGKMAKQLNELKADKKNLKIITNNLISRSIYACVCLCLIPLWSIDRLSAVAWVLKSRIKYQVSRQKIINSTATATIHFKHHQCTIKMLNTSFFNTFHNQMPHAQQRTNCPLLALRSGKENEEEKPQ